MLIVVEGPDCAGKSTLVGRLAERLPGAEVWHRGPPKLHPIDEYERPLWSYRPTDGPMILDRWHIGELVYPQVLGRKTQLDDAGLRHIELTLRSRGAVVVHMTQHTEVLQRRLRERGDDLIKVEQIPEIRRRFIRTLRYHVAQPSWTLYGDPIDAEVDAIVQDARDHDDKVAQLEAFTTYVGPPDPQVLLLGDVRGPRNDNPAAPAFVPYPATSGQYLVAGLDDALRPVLALGIPRGPICYRSIGLANACDVDDPRLLWKTLGCPRVVSLGANANRWLDTLVVPHDVAPHPQWMRRFAYRWRLAYGRYLLGLSKFKPWEDA